MNRPRSTSVRRGWRRFAAAYSANISGERFVDITIPVTSIAATGGIRFTGIYIAANSIPRFVIGPLLSSIVRRQPHRSWCAYGNWIQAVAVALLAATVMSNNAQSWAFAIAGFMAGIGAGVFGLAAQATIRNLVQQKDLPSANSTLEFIDSLFTLLIPLIAGGLIEVVGATAVLYMTSVAFTAAALLRMGLAAGDETSRDAQNPESFGSYVVGLGHTLLVPFRGARRRFLSVAMITLSGTGILLVPVASLQVSNLGGSAVAIGTTISAAGVGGTVTSFLAGRFATITRSARWTLSMLVMALMSVPVVFLSPSVAVVVVLVALSDGLASWLYVSLPTLRMASETAASLIPVIAGIMSCRALTTLVVGLGVSAAGEGTSLVLFVLASCSIGTIIVLLSGTPKALHPRQGRA